MATVSASIAIGAEPAAVLALLRDREKRARLLPSGWRLHGLLTPATDEVGSLMEVEARIGPAPLRYVIELLAVEEGLVVEGEAGGGNYLTTWSVHPREGGSAVFCEMQFEYGGFPGELFVRWRLQRALWEQLLRLKAAAEAI
jgi:hypothetical protein